MSVRRQRVSPRVTAIVGRGQADMPDLEDGDCPGRTLAMEAASYSIHWLLIKHEDGGYRGVGQ